MKVAYEIDGERLIARPQGRMEATDGDDFAAALRQKLNAATKSVTIDLDALKFVNFGGIRALLRLARSLRGGGKALDFVHGGDAVRDALDQAGFDDFFPFTPPYNAKKGTLQ